MATQPAQPARVLGPIDATCVVIGAIIGVGIFFGPSNVVKIVGTGPLALLVWAIAGVIALCGALTFAELGARRTAQGAQYEVLRDAFGSFPAFLFVFCNSTAIQAGSVGIIAIICARNLAVASGVSLDDRTALALAAALICGVTLANCLGVRWGSRIQNFTVFAKVATLLLVAMIAAFAGEQPIAGPATEPSVKPAFAAVLSALVPAFFAFGGWQHALWLSGEVRDPARNLPRAIIGGVIIVIVVYLLANWAYLALLGAPGVAASKTLAADAVGAVWPKVGARLVAGAVALSAFGVLNAQLLSGPRLVQGMAADGRFFRIFEKLHSRTGTPIAAILLIGGMGLLLMLSAGDSGLDQLLNGVLFIDGVFFALTGAALFVLRARGGDAPGFRTPLYPIVPLVFVVGELGVVAGAYLNADVRNAAYIGLAWMALGAVLYVAAFRRRHAPGGAP